MRQMLPVLGLLVVLAVISCAHRRPSDPKTPPSGLEVLRKECIENNGIFRVKYGDYAFHGWLADSAICWYGAAPANIERAKTLD